MPPWRASAVPSSKRRMLTAPCRGVHKRCTRRRSLRICVLHLHLQMHLHLHSRSAVSLFTPLYLRSAGCRVQGAGCWVHILGVRAAYLPCDVHRPQTSSRMDTNGDALQGPVRIDWDGVRIPVPVMIPHVLEQKWRRHYNERESASQEQCAILDRPPQMGCYATAQAPLVSSSARPSGC